MFQERVVKRSVDAHYRGDVDGLQAIAVVPVVLFHAGFSGFSGGYVGVDVFFVISGFLITGIIAREIHNHLSVHGALKIAPLFAGAFDSRP